MAGEQPHGVSIGIPAPLRHLRCGGSILVDLERLPIGPLDVAADKPFEAAMRCSRCKIECHWQGVIMDLLQE